VPLECTLTILYKEHDLHITLNTNFVNKLHWQVYLENHAQSAGKKAVHAGQVEI
jgi:hypothetical protein